MGLIVDLIYKALERQVDQECPETYTETLNKIERYEYCQKKRELVFDKRVN